MMTMEHFAVLYVRRMLQRTPDGRSVPTAVLICVVKDRMEFIIFGACLMWLVLVLANVFIDHKEYNNGRCKCGGAWKHFATDSHGVDGYYCEKCGEVIWVKLIH